MRLHAVYVVADYLSMHGNGLRIGKDTLTLHEWLVYSSYSSDSILLDVGGCARVSQLNCWQNRQDISESDDGTWKHWKDPLQWRKNSMFHNVTVQREDCSPLATNTHSIWLENFPVSDLLHLCLSMYRRRDTVQRGIAVRGCKRLKEWAYTLVSCRFHGLVIHPWKDGVTALCVCLKCFGTVWHGCGILRHIPITRFWHMSHTHIRKYLEGSPLRHAPQEFILSRCRNRRLEARCGITVHSGK